MKSIKFVDGSHFRTEKKGLNPELAINREVLDGDTVLLVIGAAFVKGVILFLSDVSRFANSEGFVLLNFPFSILPSLTLTFFETQSHSFAFPVIALSFLIVLLHTSYLFLDGEMVGVQV